MINWGQCHRASTGSGSRGLRRRDIQFGSEDPVAVRADGTGNGRRGLPATDAAAPARPSWRSPFVLRAPAPGWIGTAIGNNGIDLMGLRPPVDHRPVVLIAIACARRRSHASAAQLRRPVRDRGRRRHVDHEPASWPGVAAGRKPRGERLPVFRRPPPASTTRTPIDIQGRGHQVPPGRSRCRTTPRPASRAMVPPGRHA